MAPTPTVSCPICSISNPASATTCAVCGAALGADAASTFSGALPLGTKLHGGIYSIGRVLGQGGFGITYLGADVRARRPVAIKEFFPFGSTRRGVEVQPFGGLKAPDFEHARERFLDEARVLARFDHPGIVDVYGTFEENGTAYMVMELLRGQTLASLVEERSTLPEAEAVGYAVRVGESLEAIHRAGLLHRDIKPDNIMLVDDGRVVLIDFGTARSFAAGKTGRMTTLVTPGYAPLEQYGAAARFGPFTDVYALAATLYHLLTGCMPAAATDRVLGVELVPPRALNPSVSRVVNDAVLRALELRVDARPQSAREFVAALSAVVPGPPQAARKPKPAARKAAPPAAPQPRPPWRPPLPYAGPYDVEVKGDGLRWPAPCACCFESADATYRAEHTAAGGFLSLFEETRGWDVPYCSTCLEHVDRQATAPSGGAGGLMAGAQIGGTLGLILGLGSVAGAVIRAAKQSAELAGLLRPTCSALGPAVAYRGWYDDAHAFTFLSRQYAEAFAKENKAQRAA